jgi:hypothetical protein
VCGGCGYVVWSWYPSHVTARAHTIALHEMSVFGDFLDAINVKAPQQRY